VGKCNSLLEEIQIEHSESYIITQDVGEGAGYCKKAAEMRHGKDKKTVQIRFENREKCFASIYHGMYLSGKSPLGISTEEKLTTIFQETPSQKEFLKPCRAQRPMVGMTRSLLLACLGKPSKEMTFNGQGGQETLYFWKTGQSARLKNHLVTEAL
jgi:hypothetical protein